MKAKVTKLSVASKNATLVGKFKGKEITIYATASLGTWKTVFGKTSPTIDTEIEVDDNLIKVSDKGNHYIDRSTTENLKRILDRQEQEIRALELEQRERNSAY